EIIDLPTAQKKDDRLIPPRTTQLEQPAASAARRMARPTARTPSEATALPQVETMGKARNTITQVVATSLPQGGAVEVIRTSALQPVFPDTALTLIHPEPGHRTLIETDPRFTLDRPWLSSDALLAQLRLD